MKLWPLIWIALIVVGAVTLVKVAMPSTPTQPTPTALMLLEAKYDKKLADLEKRVDWLETVTGIKGGLKEGLQNRRGK